MAPLAGSPPNVPPANKFRRWVQDAMSRLPARQPGKASLARYGSAVVMIALALVIRELIGPPNIGLQFVTFFPAVALTAVYGGFWAGMLATAISAVLATFLYIPPFGEFSFDFRRATLISNLVFVLDEIMVCGAIQAMHNHYLKLRVAVAAAEDANNAKSRFLAAASHDLRQPLSALSIYVGLLGNKVAPGDGPLVDNMRNCVSSLTGLLDDLLDLSKLDAGVVKANVRDVAVGDVLAKLISAHRPKAQLRGLQLRYRGCALAARTDPVLLERIVANFVANAIRYSERGGVLISSRKRNGRAWIEVWDTGIGIPADKTAEIFEEFKQLGDGARNRGSGLGLAIAAKTAAVLDLEIRVASRLGRGSMFAVELPAAAAGV